MSCVLDNCQYTNIDGYKINYVDLGKNEPAILFLHGIPVNMFLWRKIIPCVSNYARTIAFDMIGAGKSDKPLDINYDLKTYTYFLKKFIEALNLKNVILVGTDLGLMTTLNYAMANEENVRALIMFEGIFQPVDKALKNMPISSKFMLKLMGINKIAKKAIVDKGEDTLEKMLSMLTIRRLTSEEIKAYKEPFSDKLVRKKVWFEGVGPNAIRPVSKSPGDLTDLIEKYSIKLCTSKIPKMLLYADPGSAVNKKTLIYAKENLSNLETVYIGNGKHFLPEDQPENISNAIIDFYKRLI
ncbi:UNVERIFIED_CONTAM: haloalkane dehalogenase [Acetivibrio alkalicellulosi]